MALKIGELFATLEIDDKDFSKGLQSAQEPDEGAVERDCRV